MTNNEVKRILVISDTHRSIQRARDLIERLQRNQIDTVIHCGDHISDAKLLKQYYPQHTFYMVPGNCDANTYGEERNQLIEIEGFKIFITHGDRHHVKYDYDLLYSDALAYDADVAICGHTHQAFIKQEKNILLLNPGSLSLSRDFEGNSYGILELAKGKSPVAAIVRAK